MIALLVFGLKPFLEQDFIMRTIGIAGGLFLLWMGISMLVGSKSSGFSLAASSDEKEAGFPVFTGVTFSISNPYWTIWWVTIGAAYVLYSFKVGLVGLAAFFAGHILADLLWYSSVSFAIDAGKNFISERFYRGLTAFFSLFLIALSLTFITGVEVL